MAVTPFIRSQRVLRRWSDFFRIDLAFGEAGAQALAGLDFFGVAEDGTGGGVGGDGVAAIESVLGAEEAEVLGELVKMLAFAAEAVGEAEAAEVFGGVAESFAGVAELGAGAAFELGAEVVNALAVFAKDADGVAAFEGVAKFVEVLVAFAEDARWLAAFEVLAGVFEFFAAPGEALVGETLEAGMEFGEGFAAGKGGFGDLFGGGAGGGGAEVSGEVGDGEVDFVADGADDGKL